jgi:cystathionine beta-lyase
MEEKLAAGDISAAILCSPHNPVGRVWEREELARAMALFEKYDVGVVSDEIWSDIIHPGFTHIPTQTVSEDARERTVALYAPSKTFNLAGLIGSYHVIYGDRLRARVKKESGLSHYNDLNTLSQAALIGAYSEEGAAWADELRQVIGGNASYAFDFIREHFPGMEPTRPQGTYMFWVDCAEWLAAHGMTLEELEKACWDVGVALQDGKMFHGPTHLRLNLALPKAKLEEAMGRLEEALPR